ncbi:MAG TPA: leucine-rich repeat domain-containing protein [Saprospiraceae bacterium]|nr:leucine-rich repeat domain-containing protein [Saprospiraceae bacterium]
MRSILLLSFLAFYFVGYGQIINFPDANFKNTLVNSKCVDNNGDGNGDTDADINNDGEIDISEAQVIKGLNINDYFIHNLDGIKNFTSLEYLDCGSNNIKSINLNGMTSLKSLDCHYSYVTLLEIQGLTNLVTLKCFNNSLVSLELEGLTKLETLDCNHNKLTSLNVKELINLEYLDCWFNQLTSLDVQHLIYLAYLKCSSNKFTTLDLQGLLNLKTLNCESNTLESIYVQGLMNLKSLNCSYNKLSFVDLLGLKNLESLICTSNQLSSIDVQGLINLISISCGKNEIPSLNLQGLTNLRTLDCSDNHLTSLNLQELSNLKSIYSYKNKLASLNLQGLSNLENLYCDDNQLTSLELQGLINLRYLKCSNNQITSLDLQGNTKFEELYCAYNKLESLFLKSINIINFSKISFNYNPNIKYICCDENRIIDFKIKSNSYGLKCEVNSYCSFTPGGTFYILNGENTSDGNVNGCDDLDINSPYMKYKITNGNITGSFIANSLGRYSIPVQAGIHTVMPILENPQAFTITPSSFQITFPNTSDTITQDFCITPKGIFRQTNITVIPLTPPARPGFDAQYKIVWENVGNQIESGTLNFTYDETLLDYISATQTADQVADGIIKWNFTSLLPFEKREITVTLKVNRPTDTPAVNAGNKLYLTASILDNIFTLENTVVGSYDPNDKTCLQGDRVKPDMVGEYVDYLIRFENTGNYAAENVVVKDIIDTKTLDISTLKITDASHEVYTRIEGNKVEFIFENIQLPFDDANNDGYIAFKIKTLPNLVLGDSLKNLADIYFDYNFPIRTNEAQTTVAFPVFTKDITTEVSIYPNPVTNILYLDTNEHWTKAEIFDIAGRIMRSVSLDSSTMNVSDLQSGTYFIRLKDGEKVELVKFVKI